VEIEKKGEDMLLPKRWLTPRNRPGSCSDFPCKEIYDTSVGAGGKKIA